MQALIISGGNLDMKFADSYIKDYEFACTIAADRGMKFFYERKMTPDYIVGDFDSVEPEILHYFQNMDENSRPVILRFEPEKDETDTELAVRVAVQQGATGSIFWVQPEPGLTICWGICTFWEQRCVRAWNAGWLIKIIVSV